MSQTLSLADVYCRLRDACRDAGGQAAWATERGISNAYLSDVLNARRAPGAKILSALGLTKQVRYVEARSQRAEKTPAVGAAGALIVESGTARTQ